MTTLATYILSYSYLLKVCTVYTIYCDDCIQRNLDETPEIKMEIMDWDLVLIIHYRYFHRIPGTVYDAYGTPFCEMSAWILQVIN